MSKIALKSSSSGTATFTIESPATNTDRTLVLPDNAGTVITTATTTGLNASALSTGTVAPARLGTGNPGAGNFLRGDGAWQAAGGVANVQTFDANGTWNKPASGSMARIQVWGGGGGGASNTGALTAAGGGGGGYNELVLPLSALGATENVIIGAGGAKGTSSFGFGARGGQSSFGAHCTAFGGGPSRPGGSFSLAGAGGPLSQTGEGFTSSSFTGSISLPSSEPHSTFGEALSIQEQLQSLTSFHGGFSLGSNNSLAANGGGAIYGGGGGGGTRGTQTVSGGRSVYGGAGGNGGRATTNIDGFQPGGGGGGRNNNLDGGNGGAGRVIVTVW